VRVPSR